MLGGERFDLDGQPSGVITDAEREIAQKALTLWRHVRQKGTCYLAPLARPVAAPNSAST